MATDEGDLALDPFMGSEATAHVSNALNRFFWDMPCNNTLVIV